MKLTAKTAQIDLSLELNIEFVPSICDGTTSLIDYVNDRWTIPVAGITTGFVSSDDDGARCTVITECGILSVGNHQWDQTNVIIADGVITISRPNSRITADVVSWDRETHTIEVSNLQAEGAYNSIRCNEVATITMGDDTYIESSFGSTNWVEYEAARSRAWAAYEAGGFNGKYSQMVEGELKLICISDDNDEVELPSFEPMHRAR